jgi:hypothetical protein
MIILLAKAKLCVIEWISQKAFRSKAALGPSRRF